MSDMIGIPGVAADVYAPPVLVGHLDPAMGSSAFGAQAPSKSP